VVGAHLSGLAIYKMTGSGNDFVVLDGRHSAPEDWAPADIATLCARHTGVGADGLVFLSPGSSDGSVRVVYFNNDGSRAVCGNACLCSIRLAAHLGLANPLGMRLETDAGVFEGRSVRDDHRCELRFTGVSAPVAVPGISVGQGERALLVTVGVPHLIVQVKDVGPIDVAHRGEPLRHHSALGPDGANVDFVAPSETRGEWRMRTYERGVEAETLACGTGSVAAACALDTWGAGDLPISIRTTSGALLDVRGHRNAVGGYDDIWLVGGARLVYRGVVA